MSRAHGGTVPSAGARGDAHAKAPRLASVRDAAWSSVATGVTYGDGETRLSRAQLRAGLRARKALVKKRGALVPSASKTPPVFARDAADVDVATTSRRRRAQTFDPANNAVVKRGGETREPLSEPLSEIRFETFGEAFAADASSFARRASRDAIESTEIAIAETNAESTRYFEYRDAGGEPFTVNLTNVGSPEGLTTIKLKGVDRANLLGALCSALAKAEVSVVSGSIQTDRRTGAVRNVMYVCDSETGERLDPRVFEWLSVRVLSACWHADERAWLATPRSVGRFIVAKGRSRTFGRARARRREIQKTDLDSASDARRMRDRAEDAEAKMRACSARLADAVERSDREGSVPSRTLLDGDLRALLRDVEDAAAESFAARSALEEFWKTQTKTQPRAVSGFSTAPAPLERDSAFDDQLEAFLERHERRFDTFEEEEASGRKGSLPSKEKPSAAPEETSSAAAEVFSSASSTGARATLAAATAADDASSIRAGREDTNFLDTSAMSLKALFADAYDGVSPFVKGVFFMNVASCLFGTNQVVIKQVADAGVDDFTQMFLRFAVAAVPLVPFIYQGAKGSNSKELLRGATHLGTILAVGYFLQIIGLEGTTSAKGALTSTFTVLSVPVFAGLAGQRVPWFTWPASVAAMVGVGLLTGGDGSPFVAGDAVCILSAIIFGYHTLTSSKYARLFEDQELPFISFQIGVVAAESGLWKLGEMGYRGFREHAANGFAIDAHANVDIAAFVTHTSDVAAHLPWPALLWMGLATTSFTLWIEFLALKNVSASTCALIYTAEPLWGALFAWHFMGDRWGPAGWLGAALIVGASVGSQVLTLDEDDSAEAKAEEDRAVAEADAMRDENFARY